MVRLGRGSRGQDHFCNRALLYLQEERPAGKAKFRGSDW